jgi:hypothetical protein
MEKKITIDARENLLSELKYLRATVKEAGEAYILRTEGEIETIVGYLAAMPPKDNHHIATTWLQEARGTTFKPGKGRLKDLKKVDRLLEDLLNMVIERQSPKTVDNRRIIKSEKIHAGLLADAP